MNTEETEIRMRRAATMIACGLGEPDIAAILRGEGESDEAIFLLMAAARILAR